MQHVQSKTTIKKQNNTTKHVQILKDLFDLNTQLEISKLQHFLVHIRHIERAIQIIVLLAARVNKSEFGECAPLGLCVDFVIKQAATRVVLGIVRVYQKIALGYAHIPLPHFFVLVIEQLVHIASTKRQRQRFVKIAGQLTFKIGLEKSRLPVLTLGRKV